MATIYSTFNHQPESIVATTGSYTIPAGYYAKVAAHVRSGESVSVDGVTILDSDSSTDGNVIAVNQYITSNSGYTVPSGYRFEGSVHRYASCIVYIDGIPFDANAGADTDSVPLKVGPSKFIDTSTTSNSATLIGVCIREEEPATSDTLDFFAPEGTIIAGSGGKTIALYPNKP